MQLSFDALQNVNPNTRLFDADGKPKRLLWCSDAARMGGPCPYEGREIPLGACCKQLATPVEPVSIEITDAA